MNNNLSDKNKGEIILYRSKNGEINVDVKLEKETVWLNLTQLSNLFQRDKSVISRHINNIFKEQELAKNSTVAKNATVQKEGLRYVEREIEYYNLDMIISVGYRVNSKIATNFRIWATKTLKEYLIKGYSLNHKRLLKVNLSEFERAVKLIKGITDNKNIESKEAKGLLEVITSYADSWLLLQKYDEQKLTKPKHKGRPIYKLTYKESKNAISELKKELVSRQEAGNIFGNERENMLDGILKGIYQTFDKKELYPSIEEKASHLLYFVIKDHPFTDGNKRIACLLFILFLVKNNYLLTKKNERKFNDNALVALALLVAESKPEQKDTMVKLVMNLISEK